MTINDVSALEQQAQGSDVSGDVELQNAEQQVTTEQAPVTDNATPAQVSEETPDKIIESLEALLEKEQQRNRSNFGRVSKLTKTLADLQQERDELKARLEDMTAPKIDLVALEHDYPDVATAVKALSHQVDGLKKAQTVAKPESVQIDDAEFQRRRAALSASHPDMDQIASDENFWRFVQQSYGQDGVADIRKSTDPDVISDVLTDYKNATRVKSQVSTLRQRQLAATAPAPAQKAAFKEVKSIRDLDFSKMSQDELNHYAALYEKGELRS